MTPQTAHLKKREVEALYDTLEPHAIMPEVALARQSLVGAAFWLNRIEEGRLLPRPHTRPAPEAA